MLGVHHAANLDVGAVVAPGFEGRVEVGEGDFGKEAERTQVDAEDRRGGAREGAGGGEEGAIATEDDDEIWLVPGQVDAVDGIGGANVSGAIGVEQIMVVSRFEPRDEVA